MKNQFKKIVCSAVVCISACATPLEFIPIATFERQQTVELFHVDDMEQLIQRKHIKAVYYTPEYFIVENDAVFYLLKSRGYTNFHDYKEGKLAKPEEYSIFKPGYSLKRRTTPPGARPADTVKN